MVSDFRGGTVQGSKVQMQSQRVVVVQQPCLQVFIVGSPGAGWARQFSYDSRLSRILREMK